MGWVVYGRRYALKVNHRNTTSGVRKMGGSIKRRGRRTTAFKRIGLAMTTAWHILQNPLVADQLHGIPRAE